MTPLFTPGRYANVTATLALVVALGGTSYAALKVPHGSVGNAQLRANSVTSGKVRNGTLLARDFRAGQLPAGAPGAKGDTGAPGATVFSPTIPSGATVTGYFAQVLPHALTTDLVLFGVSLPATAPAQLTAENVNFAPGADIKDGDPACTGTTVAPTAPPGKLCLYAISLSNAANAGGYQAEPGTPNGGRQGFVISWDAAAAGVTEVRAVWAYTAP